MIRSSGRRQVFELTPGPSALPANSSGRVSWKLSALGVALTPGPVTTLCLGRRIPSMRDSHDSISDFPADEIAKIAMILEIYEFSQSRSLTLGGVQ